MKTSHVLSAIGVATLATAAVAWQISIVPVLKNPLPKHLPGAWTIDTEITKRLDPDSRMAKFVNLSFTNDPQILNKYTDASARLAGMTLVLGGMMTIDGNTNPYVVSENGGCSTLVWFHPGTDTKIGDPVAKCVSIVLGKDMQSDLLFLGNEDGARGSSVCYKRSAK